ncbi:MAG: hypothetical protein ACE5L7_12515, partial [Candidatus Aminicenantales bacterium]
IAGLTIQVDSDLPIEDSTFHPKFRLFEANGPGPGEDTIHIRHHFSLPELKNRDLGERVYRRPPWAIYRKGNSWIYLGIPPDSSRSQKIHRIHRVAVFNHSHTRARIYSKSEETFLKGNLHSLTLFPTDQILLARVLADRKGCFFHSAGIIFKDKGLLFVGHSDAGKSTLMKMIKHRAKVLCDDRMIVRRQRDGFFIHGTWSHGEVPEVSPDSAPLKAVLFLEKSEKNRLRLLESRQEAIRNLLACLIKPLTTADWWERMLDLVEEIARDVPCYELQFDKTGKVIDLLNRL